MKHNKHHDNAKSAGPQLEPVRFEFTHPTAATVCIAGTFNDWQTEAKPMHPVGDGRWLKETVLPPGIYEYLLVVDGCWIPDRWPGRVCPTRLAAGTQSSGWTNRPKKPSSSP